MHRMHKRSASCCSSPTGTWTQVCANAHRTTTHIHHAPFPPATVHPDDAAALGLGPSSTFIQLADGSDSVVPTALHSTTARGTLGLSRVQQYNLRIASGHRYAFRCVPMTHQARETLQLVDQHPMPRTGHMHPLRMRMTASHWLTWTWSCAC